MGEGREEGEEKGEGIGRRLIVAIDYLNSSWMGMCVQLDITYYLGNI